MTISDETSVGELELPVRAANVLNNANIITIGQLCAKTERELMKYRNCGKLTVCQIRDHLQRYGFDLAWDGRGQERIIKELKRQLEQAQARIAELERITLSNGNREA